MITRIEIDGFKSFYDFSVDLKPFQVFIGSNSAGKSNFFDAIILLSRLVGDNSLYDAFKSGRGEIPELFSVKHDLDHPDQRAKKIKFVVEMLIGKNIHDDFNELTNVTSNRLRYELHIERRKKGGTLRLYVVYETLTHITKKDDNWVDRNIPKVHQDNWIIRDRRSPYISISDDEEMINIHQDGNAGRLRPYKIGQLERTILSTITSAQYPTAYAVRQEMLNWQFLQFNPEDLRTPSSLYAPTKLLSNGANLASVLYEIKQADEYSFNEISLDIAKFIDGLTQIEVKVVEQREEIEITALMDDDTSMTSRVLSDGTLRILALITLRYDPAYLGVLCYEEPENGVHPLRIKQSVDVLTEMATNFNEEDDTDYLAQVLVNTHSTSLLANSIIADGSVLYVEMKIRYGRRETFMTPVISASKQLYLPNFEDQRRAIYTQEIVAELLEQPEVTMVSANLKKAMSSE